MATTPKPPPEKKPKEKVVIDTSNGTTDLRNSSYSNLAKERYEKSPTGATNVSINPDRLVTGGGQTAIRGSGKGSGSQQYSSQQGSGQTTYYDNVEGAVKATSQAQKNQNQEKNNNPNSTSQFDPLRNPFNPNVEMVSGRTAGERAQMSLRNDQFYIAERQAKSDKRFSYDPKADAVIQKQRRDKKESELPSSYRRLRDLKAETQSLIESDASKIAKVIGTGEALAGGIFGTLLVKPFEGATTTPDNFGYSDIPENVFVQDLQKSNVDSFQQTLVMLGSGAEPTIKNPSLGFGTRQKAVQVPKASSKTLNLFNLEGAKRKGDISPLEIAIAPRAKTFEKTSIEGGTRVSRKDFDIEGVETFKPRTQVTDRIKNVVDSFEKYDIQANPINTEAKFQITIFGGQKGTSSIIKRTGLVKDFYAISEGGLTQFKSFNKITGRAKSLGFAQLESGSLVKATEFSSTRKISEVSLRDVLLESGNKAPDFAGELNTYKSTTNLIQNTPFKNIKISGKGAVVSDVFQTAKTLKSGFRIEADIPNKIGTVTKERPVYQFDDAPILEGRDAFFNVDQSLKVDFYKPTLSGVNVNQKSTARFNIDFDVQERGIYKLFSQAKASRIRFGTDRALNGGLKISLQDDLPQNSLLKIRFENELTKRSLRINDQKSIPDISEFSQLSFAERGIKVDVSPLEQTSVINLPRAKLSETGVASFENVNIESLSIPLIRSAKSPVKTSIFNFKTINSPRQANRGFSENIGSIGLESVSKGFAVFDIRSSSRSRQNNDLGNDIKIESTLETRQQNRNILRNEPKTINEVRQVQETRLETRQELAIKPSTRNPFRTTLKTPTPKTMIPKTPVVSIPPIFILKKPNFQTEKTPTTKTKNRRENQPKNLYILPDLASVSLTEAVTGKEAIAPRATPSIIKMAKLAFSGQGGFIPTEQIRTKKVRI